LSRPIYENEFDLSNEEIVKQAIEKTGVVLHKLPMSYRMDYMAFRDDKPSSVIEVKSRKKGTSSTTFPWFMVSLLKWHAGIDYVHKSGIPFILAGKYDDGIFFYKYSPDDNVDIKWFGGRKDRQDTADQEPCVYIPMTLFKKL